MHALYTLWVPCEACKCCPSGPNRESQERFAGLVPIVGVCKMCSLIQPSSASSASQPFILQLTRNKAQAKAQIHSCMTIDELPASKAYLSSSSLEGFYLPTCFDKRITCGIPSSSGEAVLILCRTSHIHDISRAYRLSPSPCMTRHYTSITASGFVQMSSQTHFEAECR